MAEPDVALEMAVRFESRSRVVCTPNIYVSEYRADGTFGRGHATAIVQFPAALAADGSTVVAGQSLLPSLGQGDLVGHHGWIARSILTRSPPVGTYRPDRDLNAVTER